MARSIEYSQELREKLMHKALYDAYPGSVSARDLMSASMLPWAKSPVTAFVSLCISFNSLNRNLSGTRLQAVRTGRTPDDYYSLSHIGDG